MTIGTLHLMCNYWKQIIFRHSPRIRLSLFLPNAIIPVETMFDFWKIKIIRNCLFYFTRTLFPMLQAREKFQFQVFRFVFSCWLEPKDVFAQILFWMRDRFLSGHPILSSQTATILFSQTLETASKILEAKIFYRLYWPGNCNACHCKHWGFCYTSALENEPWFWS